MRERRRALVELPADATLPAALSAMSAALSGAGPALLPLPAPGGQRDRISAALRADEPLERDDVALVVPTSGSTGEPKGVLLTAAALLASAHATHSRLGGPGRWLLALPTTHIAGLQVLVRSVVAGTTPEALAGRFGPEAFAAATARLADGPGPRYTALVPTQLARLVDAGADLTAYDAVLVGAAATPAPLLARARAGGARVVTTYGMSETCGGCVYDGRPLDGVKVEVSADGRLRLGGPTIFAGYRLRPDLTAAALVEGWHLTQDLGRIDAHRRLHVLGRADETIISGGVNVPATAVAATLEAHPAVAAAHVHGRPDPHWGQLVVAVIVPVEPGSPPALSELREWVAGRLGPAASPRGLAIVAALPQLPNGKPDRAALEAVPLAQSWPSTP